jgi:hypothetical protein
VEAAAAELAARGRLTKEMCQPAQLWVQLVLETARSLFRGKFDAAEETLREAFELREPRGAAPLTRSSFSAPAAARARRPHRDRVGPRERSEYASAHGLELNAYMGARPWVAHTQEDYGRLLLQRGRPPDRERARELAGSALATYRELGMRPHADRLALSRNS